MWYNPNHLREAKSKAGRPDAGYWWHFRLAIGEFFFLFAICIGSLLNSELLEQNVKALLVKFVIYN